MLIEISQKEVQADRKTAYRLLTWLNPSSPLNWHQPSWQLRLSPNSWACRFHRI